LIDKEGKVANFHNFGFHERDRLDIVEFTSKPESMFEDKRITRSRCSNC
jgi:hypothetical protein